MESLPSINKVYSLIAQEERDVIPTIVIDESSILANAYDVNMGYGWGMCFNHGGYGENSLRYFTYCDRYGHTIEFSIKNMVINKWTNLPRL